MLDATHIKTQDARRGNGKGLTEMGWGRACGLATLLALLTHGASVARERTAQLVVWGGRIYPDAVSRPREAVAVIDGRIAFVGDRRRVRRFIGQATQVIDLHGAALFPGFTDSHAHLRAIGERELSLDLAGSRSAAEVGRRLGAFIAQHEPSGTVYGDGWLETAWPEGRYLDRRDIDPIAPEQPVLLMRADGHAVVANSAALRAAGVDEKTAQPAGGRILRDVDGRLTGMFVDNAMSLVMRLVRKPTEADRLAAFEAGVRRELAYGWTGVHNMSVTWADVLMLEVLAMRNALPLRVYNGVYAGEAQPLFAGGARSAGDDRVVTRAIKVFADGSLGSRGAALFERYADADTTGLIVTPPEQLRPLLAQALAGGIQVCAHAIGDRGNAMMLDLYGEALGGGGTPRRWRIEHAQVLREQDIPRFAHMGVIASMQPSHAISDLHFAPKRLGMERLAGAYAWKSLRDAGAVVTGGSDAPVEQGDPLIEFYAAVARRDLTGFSGEGWHPEQALSRAEALRLFTSAAAYARFAEHELGVIAPGRRADFSAFSIDLMTAPVEDILKGHAVLTVVDGAVVYQRPS